MQDSYLKDIKILISSVITAFCLPVSGCASSMDQVESKQSIWPEYSACTNYEIYDYSLEASIQQAAEPMDLKCIEIIINGRLSKISPHAH